MSSSTDTRPAPVPEGGVLPSVSLLRMPELRSVETTREAAQAQGYAVGWAQGRREAEASARAQAEELATAHAERESRRQTEHATAVAALHEAARAAHEQLAAACRLVDDQAAALTLELTRALVGAAHPDPAHVLERVVGLVPEHPVVSVRLHPDVAALAGDLRALSIAVVADPTLGRADAVAHADDHVVDLRVDEALDRLSRVLG
jgi:flagellar assembly protein FliH